MQTRSIVLNSNLVYRNPLFSGILGVETGFGSNKGSFVTRDALATLGFGYERRAAILYKMNSCFNRMEHIKMACQPPQL